MRNPLVPYLARHCLAGAAAGWLSASLLVWLDVAGLGTLVWQSDLWPVPLLMLLAFFGLTFGNLAMGAAVMSLGRGGGPTRSRPQPVESRQPDRSLALATSRR